MLYLDPHRIIETRIAESMGFDKYKMSIEHVRKVDVSADLDFQRTYNGFYRIRRNAEWRAAYYGIFEEIKNSSPTFEQIIRTLYRDTGNIEASFSSKMLATIRPEMPILDQFVLTFFNLIIEGYTPEERINSAMEVYRKIVEEESKMLKDPTVKKEVKQFKEYFMDYKISDVKALDYMIWGQGRVNKYE